MCFRANHLRNAAIIFSAAIIFVVILSWVMFAALLDDILDTDSEASLTRAAPYVRATLRHSSRVSRVLPHQAAPHVEEEVMEYNLRRCDCRLASKEANGPLGVCRCVVCRVTVLRAFHYCYVILFHRRCRGSCPTYVNPAFLTEAAGQSLCSPYEKTGYNCYAECKDENSAIVNWFASPCGNDAQETCDPLLKMTKRQLEAKRRLGDPLDGFARLAAPAKNGEPEQIWINLGATVCLGPTVSELVKP